MCHFTPRSLSLRQTPGHAGDESGGDDPIGSLRSHAAMHADVPLHIPSDSAHQPGRKHIGVSAAAFFGGEAVDLPESAKPAAEAVADGERSGALMEASPIHCESTPVEVAG